MKKTEAKITKDTEKQKQMAAECAEIEKDVPALESKKAELEGRVEKEEAALSALLDSLKGEMAEIGAQLDQVQKELAPWEETQVPKSVRCYYCRASVTSTNTPKQRKLSSRREKVKRMLSRRRKN